MSSLNVITHPISIKEVSIGTKKLTKNIFSQIEFARCFNTEMDFVGDNYLGYVKDKDVKYLLWVSNSKLRKSNITAYYRLSTDLERANFDQTEWFLREFKIAYDSTNYNGYLLHKPLRDSERYLVMVKKAQSFLSGLEDNQIFI